MPLYLYEACSLELCLTWMGLYHVPCLFAMKSKISFRECDYSEQSPACSGCQGKVGEGEQACLVADTAAPVLQAAPYYSI